MGSKGPSNNVGTPVHRVVKEVKRNWWLWGAVCFALVLITGVVMFRHKLYNTGNIGLPFLAGEKQEQLAAVAQASFNTCSGLGTWFVYRQLTGFNSKPSHRPHHVCAVKENAAETCASKCRLSSADDSLLSAEEPREVKTKQEYDACYSKCVAQETKEVAEEREKVNKFCPVVTGPIAQLCPASAYKLWSSSVHTLTSNLQCCNCCNAVQGKRRKMGEESGRDHGTKSYCF